MDYTQREIDGLLRWRLVRRLNLLARWVGIMAVPWAIMVAVLLVMTGIAAIGKHPPSGRLMLAVTITMGSWVGCTILMGAALLAVTFLAVHLVLVVVFTIVAEPREALDILRNDDEVERRSHGSTVVITLGWAGVTVAYLLTMRPDEAELLRFASLAVSMLTVSIIVAGQFHVLRAARVAREGFARALDLAYGYIPTLASGLVLTVIAATATLGFDGLLTASTAAARSIHASARSLVTGFEPRTQQERTQREAKLILFDSFLEGATVVSDTAVVRDRPDLRAKVLARLHRDDGVAVLTKRQDWIQVRTELGPGWIGSGLVVVESLDEKVSKLRERLLPLVAAIMISAGIASIIAPIILRRKASFAWALCGSVAGTLIQNGGVALAERLLGKPMDPNTWQVILFASLLSLIVSLVWEKRFARHPRPA